MEPIISRMKDFIKNDITKQLKCQRMFINLQIIYDYIMPFKEEAFQFPNAAKPQGLSNEQ